MVTTSLQNVCYKKWCINLTSPLPPISLKPPLVRVSDLPVDPSSLHLQSRGQVSSPSSGSLAHNSCSSCLDCWWCFSLSSNIHLSKILMIVFTFLTLTGPENSSCYALPMPTFIFFFVLIRQQCNAGSFIITWTPTEQPALTRIVLCIKSEVLQQPAQSQLTLTLWSAEIWTSG